MQLKLQRNHHLQAEEMVKKTIQVETLLQVAHKKCYYRVNIALSLKRSIFRIWLVAFVIIIKTFIDLLTDLQSFLSGLQSVDGASGGRAIDLASAINAEAIDKIATDSDRTNTLAAHLPTIETSDTTKKQLKDTIASPQFQQALSSFSTALQSGQLGPVVSQFQLSSEAVAAANTGDLEQFVKALEKSNNASAENAEKKEKKEKSDETDQDTLMEEDKNA